jgi:GrpB-like predicted nucleotidyltransferase (UPF0157 family)
MPQPALSALLTLASVAARSARRCQGEPMIHIHKNTRTDPPPAACDAVTIAPYDPAWPARYCIERHLIKMSLRDLEPQIEHIGSTAVPGLAAKPVIDMLVGVSSLDAFERHIPRLTMYGYEYIPDYECVLPDRRFFKRVVAGERTHHVHVVEAEGHYWRRYLKFRDMLRCDGALAGRYAELKRRLAARFRYDRDAYTHGKTGFVEAVLALPVGCTVPRVPLSQQAALAL